MPKCKNCGKNLIIDDKDICPHCGQNHPFDINNENDQTQFIDEITDLDLKPVYQRRSFKVYITLFLIFGVFGLHHFYAKKPKQGLVLLLINASFIVGFGFLFRYVCGFTENMAYLGWIMSFGICFAIYLVLGLIALVRHNTLDGEGQVID